MYIVNYVINKDYHWKTFTHYSMAWDFMEMCNNPIKVIKFCPTSPKPEIIWHHSWENKAKMPDPLVMPVVENAPSIELENERNLVIEEAVDKVYSLIKGLAEQLKRLGGVKL